MTCPECGAEHREGARFCDSCGSRLEDVRRPQETRRTVTILFCDVAGYTETGERLDPEALRKLQSRYFDDARTALERHGATVEKFIGDAVMAVFGIPRIHEDDALRAARAALELHDAVASLGLQARIGINSGEVVAGAGDALVTGDTVNVAARLEQAAEPGVILIGDATHRLLSGAVTSELVGPLAAKGKTEPLRAWRLLAVREDAEAITRKLDSPMVGRAREHALLRQAFDRARDELACHLFTILGPAGVGKSRLVAELVRELGSDARIVAGRCLPYGEGITFWPLFEVLDDLGPDQSAHVRELLESGAPSPEAVFFAARRLLEDVAGEQPLVVVLDDVHWAEPTFLDLIDHVSDLSREAPILLVCLARPELLDLRPAWGGGKLNATSVLLEPLGGPDCELLLQNLLGETELETDARTRILAAAEGNPLFVEQMLEVLIDDGLLERRNGSWVATGDLTDLAVPPTIQVLLAARLDRLNADERSVVERAAVEGALFHRGAVAELAPERVRPQVTTHLLSLVRKELVRPGQTDFPDEDAFRFRHLLIRDTAYESLPKQDRAELHERFATWLESKVGERRAEYEEILGYHLEQAHRYRSELGDVDAELARRAAARLGAAGQRAQRRGDVRAAVNLVDRAVSLDPERVELLPVLGASLMEAGDLARAEAVLAEAVTAAKAANDGRTEALARLEHALLRSQTDPSWTFVDARREAEDTAETFEDLGDHLVAARAWQSLGLLEFWGGQCAKAEAAYEQVVANTQRAGSQEGGAVEWWAAAAAVFGPRPAFEADQRCLELAARAPGDLYVVGFIWAVRGVIAAMECRWEEARSFRERGRTMTQELGARLHLAGMSNLFGYVDDLAGDPRAAEVEYRRGYDVCLEIGETGYLSTVACDLGEAVYAQGRYDEAFGLSEDAERFGAPDDIMTNFKWRALRARVMARQGRFDEADLLVREAVEQVRATDYLNDLAETIASLAEVRELAAKPREARAAYEEALELFQKKGNLAASEHIRRRLANLRGE